MQSTATRPATVEDVSGTPRRIVDVVETGEGYVVVARSGASPLRVPLASVDRGPDRWTLRDRWADVEARAEAEHVRVPLVEETVHIGKREVETGRVRIHKTVQHDTQTVDLPLLYEHVEVERVPIERYVSEPPPVREEGDVLVVPCVEEVLVVEKRLLLREELRVTRSRETRHRPQEVTVRREEVEVERTEPDAPTTPHTDTKR